MIEALVATYGPIWGLAVPVVAGLAMTVLALVVMTERR